MRPADAVYQELTELFRDLFMDDDLVLRPDMTADDIKNWDSINHINLLVAVESRFGIRISTMGVEKLKCVGDLADLITAGRV